MNKNFLQAAFFVLLSPVFAFSAIETDSLLNDSENPYSLSLSAEIGAVKVLAHTIQFGNSGSEFDYVREGAQDILAPFSRFSADFTINDKHTLVFLYQPLLLETSVTLTQELVVDSTTFTNGSAVNLKYGFSFWRLSYLYHFIDNEKMELSAGLSLQLRNASIAFESTDGSIFSGTQNLGPVPILKARFFYRFENGFWMGTEVDGFYASSSFFNGADFDFEGSILDASLRFGVNLTEYLDGYLNLRYLGGSARGTSEYTNPLPGVDGFTANYLDTMSLTIGFTIR